MREEPSTALLLPIALQGNLVVPLLWLCNYKTRDRTPDLPHSKLTLYHSAIGVVWHIRWVSLPKTWTWKKKTYNRLLHWEVLHFLFMATFWDRYINLFIFDSVSGLCFVNEWWNINVNTGSTVAPSPEKRKKKINIPMFSTKLSVQRKSTH